MMIPVCPKCNHPHYNMEDTELCAKQTTIDSRTGHFENCPIHDSYPIEACDCGPIALKQLHQTHTELMTEKSRLISSLSANEVLKLSLDTANRERGSWEKSYWTTLGIVAKLQGDLKCVEAERDEARILISNIDKEDKHFEQQIIDLEKSLAETKKEAENWESRFMDIGVDIQDHIAYINELEDSLATTEAAKCPVCHYQREKHGDGLGLTEEEANSYAPCEYCWLKEEVKRLKTESFVSDAQLENAIKFCTDPILSNICKELKARRKEEM